VPARTAPEFIAYAKANPGKINMASAASDPRPMRQANCSRYVYVPYRGGAAAITDLIGGQVQVMIEPMAGSSTSAPASCAGWR
jgi:tripartite-type tricarboxylate transporter receptor subunit TctC